MPRRASVAVGSVSRLDLSQLDQCHAPGKAGRAGETGPGFFVRHAPHIFWLLTRDAVDF